MDTMQTITEDGKIRPIYVKFYKYQIREDHYLVEMNSKIDWRIHKDRVLSSNPNDDIDRLNTQNHNLKQQVAALMLLGKDPMLKLAEISGFVWGLAVDSKDHGLKLEEKDLPLVWDFVIAHFSGQIEPPKHSPTIEQELIELTWKEIHIVWIKARGMLTWDGETCGCIVVGSGDDRLFDTRRVQRPGEKIYLCYGGVNPEEMAEKLGGVYCRTFIPPRVKKFLKPEDIH